MEKWFRFVVLLHQEHNDENLNVTDRKLGKRTSMLPRMLNRALLVLVVHISFRTPFAANCRLVVNVSMSLLRFR